MLKKSINLTKIFKIGNSTYSFSTTTNQSLVSYDLISNNKDIGLITIKNSAKRNALSLNIINDMMAELEKIEYNFKHKNFPRVVIVSTEGTVFSSGHDLKELNSSTEAKQKEIFHKCSDMMIKIENSSSIFIAEVQGLATAAGCQLAATCDLVVASSKAKFETPGVKIGLFCSTPSVALSRAISIKRAMHMLVTGEQIDAQKALNWGLVNEVVDVESIKDEAGQRVKLREHTLKLAENINQFSGATLSFGKKVFYNQAEMSSIEDAYGLASVSMCSNISFKDTQEGINAFLQKRKPSFNKI